MLCCSESLNSEQKSPTVPASGSLIIDHGARCCYEVKVHIMPHAATWEVVLRCSTTACVLVYTYYSTTVAVLPKTSCCATLPNLSRIEKKTESRACSGKSAIAILLVSYVAESPGTLRYREILPLLFDSSHTAFRYNSMKQLIFF